MTAFLDRISFETGLSKGVLQRIATTAAHRYKTFSIPKKSGRGVRLVAQPAREVKLVQRAIVKRLSPMLPVHDAVKAYRKGVSIKDNAAIHSGSRYLLKLDFEDFFPSVHDIDLRAHLEAFCRHELTDAEIDFVVRTSVWRTEAGAALRICIGAPSSPFWANTVPFNIDASLGNLASANGCAYSRYSDDLTFSSLQPDRLSIIERSLPEVLTAAAYPRLRLNSAKRVAVSRKHSFRVTGLFLSQDGRVTVGADRKRGVRAGIHRYLRGLVPAEQMSRLRGEVAFVLGAEPAYRDVIKRQLGDRWLEFWG